MAACNALDAWLSLAPDRKAYFVAHSRHDGEVCWRRGMNKATLHYQIGWALRGKIQYSLLSVRHTFLTRVRDELGTYYALHLGGYTSLQALNNFLANEPDWSEVPALF
jgi:hypothetical protein